MWTRHQIIHYPFFTTIHWMIQTFLLFEKCSTHEVCKQRWPFLHSRMKQTTSCETRCSSDFWCQLDFSNQKNRMSSLKLLEPAMICFPHAFSSFMYWKCTDLKSSNWNITRTACGWIEIIRFRLQMFILSNTSWSKSPSYSTSMMSCGRRFVCSTTWVSPGRRSCSWQMLAMLLSSGRSKWKFFFWKISAIQCDLFIPYLEVT